MHIIKKKLIYEIVWKQLSQAFYVWISDLCEHFFVLRKRLFSFALYPQSICILWIHWATFIYFRHILKSYSFQFYMIFVPIDIWMQLSALIFKKIFNHHHLILYSVQMAHRFAHFFLFISKFESIRK